MELTLLKCVKCGAKLDEPNTSEYLKCTYCGFAQKVIDSEKYIEKLRNEFYQLFKGLTPIYDIDSPTTVDKEARRHIFSYDITPKISTEKTRSNLKTTTLFSHGLLYLPFVSRPSIIIEDNPKNVFENLTKLEWLSPYAVDTEHIRYHTDVTVSAALHAYLVNIFSLILENAETVLIVNNLKTITERIETSGIRVGKPEHVRLEATLKFYESIHLLIYRHEIQTASTYIKKAGELMKKARIDSVNPESAYMIPSIEKDLKSIESLEHIIETASMYFDVGIPVSEFILKLEKFLKTVENYRAQNNWNVSTFEEITKTMRDTIAAKTGKSTIDVIQGDGNILVPMWAISTTYTFVTGSMFMKKGKEVQDMILVCGTMATHKYTDIFLQKSGAGFLTRLSGKEETMSRGLLGGLADSIKPTSITWSTKVLPLMITKDEARKIYEAYIGNVRHSHDKIKLGMGGIARLVFARGIERNGEIEIPALHETPIRISPHLNLLLDISV